MTAVRPLSDVTNLRRSETRTKQMSANVAELPSPSFPSNESESLTIARENAEGSVPTPVHRYQHDPYHWMGAELTTLRPANPSSLPQPSREVSPTMSGDVGCFAVVQHKCHLTECSCPFTLGKGQYVVVQGDRGIDIGVVIRVAPHGAVGLPDGSTVPTVLRYASQREVDYWALDLKAIEASALEFCRQKVQRHRLAMEVRHAEYQFDKKKLTFYFDAKTRVDFVQVLRELYREFGCRIWMEKLGEE